MQFYAVYSGFILDAEFALMFMLMFVVDVYVWFVVVIMFYKKWDLHLELMTAMINTSKHRSQQHIHWGVFDQCFGLCILAAFASIVS